MDQELSDSLMFCHYFLAQNQVCKGRGPERCFKTLYSPNPPQTGAQTPSVLHYQMGRTGFPAAAHEALWEWSYILSCSEVEGICLHLSCIIHCYGELSCVWWLCVIPQWLWNISWSWNGDGIRGHLYSVFPAGTNSITTNQLLTVKTYSAAFVGLAFQGWKILRCFLLCQILRQHWLIKHTVNTLILWNIVTTQNNRFLCEYIVKCNLFLWSKLYFQHHYSSLQCHMIFRNHSNMLLCCSRNIINVELLHISVETMIHFIFQDSLMNRKLFIWNRNLLFH